MFVLSGSRIVQIELLPCIESISTESASENGAVVVPKRWNVRVYDVNEYIIFVFVNILQSCDCGESNVLPGSRAQVGHPWSATLFPCIYTRRTVRCSVRSSTRSYREFRDFARIRRFPCLPTLERWYTCLREGVCVSTAVESLARRVRARAHRSPPISSPNAL